MIQSLYIRNYVLIDKLEMQFAAGFTTITGETGAGKSILMGALGLILGQRVDTSVLKLKDAKCIVEGSFQLDAGLRKLFEGHELDFDQHSTLRREIAPGGKSRAFVNDTPVTLPVLREIGSQLVDIHSQHQSLQLSDHRYQLEVVDYLGHTGPELTHYQEVYARYEHIGAQMEALRTEAQRLKEDLDYMQFQFNELDAAQLKEGELEELESEFQRAEHAGEIGQALMRSTQLLQAEQNGVLDQLSEILSQLRKISGYYAPAHTLTQRLESGYIEIKDLSAELDALAGKSELEPGKLELLQERIDLLYGLMQKHRVKEPGALIELREELSSKIEEVTFSDEKLDGLERERDSCMKQMEELALKMHQKRQSAGEGMEKKVVAQLRELGIPHARFSVAVDRLEAFDSHGCDEVRFLFSANKQLEQEEVSRVASGGEVSRLMLCIKDLLSDRKGMPTLIFDEIDAGVGGEIAERFGNIMVRMAKGRQVLAITHLPQVASLGKEHFVVFKEDTSHANYTRIRKLDQGERVKEIARMLSGESVTKEALSNARVLLKV